MKRKADGRYPDSVLRSAEEEEQHERISSFYSGHHAPGDRYRLRRIFQHDLCAGQGPLRRDHPPPPRGESSVDGCNQPLLKDFEGRTGIKVNLEAYGEDQLTQKLTTEFTAGGSDIDVFMQRPLQEARQYVQNKWYADLNPFVKDLAKTPADWNFRDFQSGAVGTELVKGQLTGIRSSWSTRSSTTARTCFGLRSGRPQDPRPAESGGGEAHGQRQGPVRLRRTRAAQPGGDPVLELPL